MSERVIALERSDRPAIDSSEARNAAPWRAKAALALGCLTVFFSGFGLRDGVVDTGLLSVAVPEMIAIAFFAAFLFCVPWREARPFFCRRTLILDIGVAAFVAVNFASVAVAADKSSALQFAIRVLYLGGIYLAFSRLSRRLPVPGMVGAAIAASLAAVTLMGILESLLGAPARTRLFAHFQESATSFNQFYYLRVASTLGFPTVLSVFLDMALPVALALGMWQIGRLYGRGERLLAMSGIIAMAALVMVVQLLTFTRVGLIAGPLSLAAGALLAMLMGFPRRVPAVLFLGAAMLVLAAGASVMLDREMAVRLGLAAETPRYSVQYGPLQLPPSMALGGSYTAAVDLTNTGSATWGVRGSATDEVSLSYHWISEPNNSRTDVRYLVTYMPAGVGPGDSTSLDAGFLTPSRPGTYTLQFDLVQPQWGWFSSTGAPTASAHIRFDANGKGTVLPPAPSGTSPEAPGSVAAAGAADNASGSQPTGETASRRQLWQAALAAFRDEPLLGVGADQFRNRYSDYLGTPGDSRLSAHDIFLETMANTGILGLAAMLVIIIAAARLLLTLMRTRDIKPGLRMLSLGLFVALLAYLGHSLFDSFLWQTGTSFLLFAILGLTAWIGRSTAAPAN